MRKEKREITQNSGDNTVGIGHKTEYFSVKASTYSELLLVSLKTILDTWRVSEKKTFGK